MRSLDADKASSKSKNGTDSAQAAPAVEEKIDFSKVQIEPLFTDYVDFDTFSKSDFRAVKVKECVAVPKSKNSFSSHWTTEQAQTVPSFPESTLTMSQKNW